MLNDDAFPVSPTHIDAVRRFNRFHTRLVGALDEHILESDFALPQARLIYELGTARIPRAAADLARKLAMDTGYLSRMITAMESAGLIIRTTAPDNARRRLLDLTPAGRSAFEMLDTRSAAEVADVLAGLAPADRAVLVAAMTTIRRLLGDSADDPVVVLRPPEPGDLGWIVHRQARLYTQEYGWDWTFEILLADIVANFGRNFDPERECCRVADRDGEIVGSVFIVRDDKETAKLRLLYVEPHARGAGIGRLLVETALRFARERGYRQMVLWTNDILTAARRIYEATGFECIAEEPHFSFGKDLVGQTWRRDL